MPWLIYLLLFVAFMFVGGAYVNAPASAPYVFYPLQVILTAFTCFALYSEARQFQMQKNYLQEALNYAEVAQSVLCFYVIWGIDYANDLSDMDYWI